jgi:hypothetical protein
MGRKLGFFESFAFFQVGRRPRAFVGPVALTCVLRFKVILVPRLGCPQSWYPTVAPEALVESKDSAKG